MSFNRCHHHLPPRLICVLSCAFLLAFGDRFAAAANPSGGIVLSESFASSEIGPAGWVVSKSVPGRDIERALVWPPGSVNAGDGRALLIRGTGERNNPARRQLSQPFAGDELFVRFLIEYDARSIDRANDGDGEFFVLWLDESGGSDASTHSGNLPNIGLHVDGSGRNAFMVRFSPDTSAFADVELTGDRAFMIVARLWKSKPGADSMFDSLDLWVDPNVNQRQRPMTRSISPRGPRTVKWVGFSTGRKTERDDAIFVDQLVLARSWEAALGLPSPDQPDSLEPAPLVLLTPRELKRPAPFGNDIATADQQQATLAPQPRTRSPEQVARFRSHVYPLLKSQCFDCHAGADADSGLRLDVLDELLGHSTGEPLAVPGKAAVSRLIEVITADADADDRMPPADSGDLLSEAEVAELTRWVNEGLAWDDVLLPPATVETKHWAFQPIVRPDVPQIAVDRSAFRGNAIDAFLAEKQIAAGVVPVRRAGRRTAIRRLSLDLLGLPPQPYDVEAFTFDESPDAYERLVDRLLASPAYGERWGRHWLDVARFAESNGYQHNRNRPHAWRYRDYVVRSFNADKPYDRFIREQVAGDEIEPYSDDNIIATGFLAAARYSGNERDKRVQRGDLMVDVVNATANGLLGLTFGCAQCHNHKFDPVSIRDYYRFAAFFLRAQPVNVVLNEAASGSPYDAETRNALVEERNVMFEIQHAKNFAAERHRRPKGEIFVLPKTVERGINGSERVRYDELGRAINRWPQTWAFYSPVTAATPLAVPRLEVRWALPFGREQSQRLQPRIKVKGDPRSPGPAVEPGWPAVFGPVPGDAPTSHKPRTVLADWLTSRENPLTARVWVNRIWQAHFGRGLVADAGNFGTQTPRPQHADVLDWLSSELIDSGWSTKHIHRLIVCSDAYRRSSKYDEHNAERDPANDLFWRWLPRRLESEAIRDSLLAVTGELSGLMSGPSLQNGGNEALIRRSVYLHQKRDGMPPMQNLFDGPDAVAACSRRQVSTVPLQPLFLLNSNFMSDRSAKLAARIAADASSDEQRVRRIFSLLLSREPGRDELDRSIAFLRAVTEQTGEGQPGPSDDRQAAGEAVLRQLCLALLNLNEFVYLP
ncbi:MAG: PSD1 and planctomycete cytochrome C domain-containing protein [Planctomycetota bacterium]|jgi:hypothetical protein